MKLRPLTVPSAIGCVMSCFWFSLAAYGIAEITISISDTRKFMHVFPLTMAFSWLLITAIENLIWLIIGKRPDGVSE